MTGLENDDLIYVADEIFYISLFIIMFEINLTD